MTEMQVGELLLYLGLLLGLTYAVICQAPCPVLVVPLSAESAR